jgi:hypothetical protein
MCADGSNDRSLEKSLSQIRKARKKEEWSLEDHFCLLRALRLCGSNIENVISR